ncbi:MAG: hypothetical protein WCS72_17240, partial [Deltaproteobacteria bacterium]
GVTKCPVTVVPVAGFFIGFLRSVERADVPPMVSVRVESFNETPMDPYASWCGRAIAAFSMISADRNEKDPSALASAGRCETSSAAS